MFASGRTVRRERTYPDRWVAGRRADPDRFGPGSLGGFALDPVPDPFGADLPPLPGVGGVSPLVRPSRPRRDVFRVADVAADPRRVERRLGWGPIPAGRPWASDRIDPASGYRRGGD